MVENSICDRAIIAEHNRYKCWGCQRKIKEGQPLLRKGESGNFGYQSHSFCHRCAERILEQDQQILTSLNKTHKEVKKTFEEIKPKCAKALIIAKMEDEEQNQIEEERREKWKRDYLKKVTTLSTP